jgi:hypothetical protein
MERRGALFLSLVIGVKWFGLVTGALLVFCASSYAETVTVKYRGEVDLSHFSCQTVERSSVVRRVCYDADNAYLLISLRGTYYHYCGIDPETVRLLLASSSVGRYYNASIKGRFDCRISPPPTYD